MKNVLLVAITTIFAVAIAAAFVAGIALPFVMPHILPIWVAYAAVIIGPLMIVGGVKLFVNNMGKQ